MAHTLCRLLVIALAIAGGSLGIAAVVLATTRAARTPAVIAMVLGGLCIPLGFVGQRLTTQFVEAATSGESLDESQRQQLRAFGDDDARAVARLGLLGAIPGLGLGAVALLVSRTKKGR